MFTFTTTQLTKYSAYDMEQFLIAQNEHHFEIVIPRKKCLPESKRYQVFWEYHLAAYAGHLIAGTGDCFAYNVPSEYTRRPFRFEIETRQHRQLIDMLSRIVTSICVKKEINEFEISASEFFIQAFGAKSNPATYGLIIKANEILDLTFNSDV